MLGKLLQRRYQLVRLLDAAGSCRTYIAQDTQSPQQPKCIVKQFHPISSHPQAVIDTRQLFTREVEALKTLQGCASIPQLLAFFEEDLQFYLVEEFIAGKPLTAELLPGEKWTESAVVQLLQEVLTILEFIHAHGLIHRNITPSNIIRRRTDNRLVLVNFGSVKQAWTQVVTTEGKTSSSFVANIPATIAIGTPGYMSPELARGKPRPNSDIYALGAIAIQALTGVNPTYLLDAAGEIIWQDRVSVSDRTCKVVQTMVRYRHQDRYQSATAALQALQPLLTQGVLPAIERRLQVDTTKRDSVLLIGVVTGVVVAISFMVGSYHFLQPSAPAAPEIQRTPDLL